MHSLVRAQLFAQTSYLIAVSLTFYWVMFRLPTCNVEVHHNQAVALPNRKLPRKEGRQT